LASIGGKNDKTCISLLKELPFADNGFLHLHHLKIKSPALKIGIERLLKNNEFENFFQEYPQCKQHLFFDNQAPALVIDDPQLRYYLSRVSVERIVRITGKTDSLERNKVFISYSHSDNIWLKRVLIHLKHLEKNGLIDLWVDERINAGQNWREEISKALNLAKVAILLISQEFLASDFIVDNELPPILQAAQNDHVKILQLFISPCSIQHFEDLNKFQMVNNPKKLLAPLTKVKQEEILVQLASLVDKYCSEK
jgi:hypothetical protein